MGLNKVLVTAQSFGYGPSSKAVTIGESIKKISPKTSLTFAGESTSLVFAKENRDVFDEIVEVNSIRKLVELLETKSFDHVISVMEPIMATLAYSKKVPVSYVDSLYFFWKWQNILKKTTPKKLKEEFSKKYYPECINTLMEMHPHERQLVAHILSTQSFVQRFPGFKRDDVSAKEIGNVIPIKPIIDITWIAPKKRNLLLISFCGQLSSVVDLKKAIDYVTLCIDLISDGLKKLDKNITPIVVGNPKVMRELRKHISLKAISLSHQEYLRTLNRAVGLVVPVSITSIYEALAYNVPVIFLPEQHDGHALNYMKLLSGNRKGESFKKSFPGILFYEWFPQLKYLPEEGTVKIYDLVTALKNGAHCEFVRKSKRIFGDVIPKLADYSYREKLIKYQKRSVGGKNLIFHGGSITIAKNVVNLHT